MATALPIESTHVILCEGREDQMILEALLRHLGCANVHVQDVRGKENLRPEVRVILRNPRASSVVALAIVRDADNSAADAFRSVEAAVRDGGGQPPGINAEITAGPPSIGILLVPPGADRGEMEDVCLSAIRELPEFECVESFLECARDRRGVPENRSKAQVHAWLAAQPEAYIQLGVAASKGWLPFDAEAFRGLREFLRQFASVGTASEP